MASLLSRLPRSRKKKCPTSKGYFAERPEHESMTAADARGRRSSDIRKIGGEGG
jgi:hypothetical protein